MLVRPARREDLGRLLDLVQALARHHDDVMRATPETLERDLFDPVPWFFALVAEEAGTLTGYVTLLRLGRFQYGQRGIDLHHVFVTEAHRGQGHGRALITAALEFGGRLGASYATVTATPQNRAAQAYYRKLGFSDAPQFGARFWTPIPGGFRYA